MAREGKEVLGKHCSNLWLLTLVLVATFSSIAFSEGSMIYLRDKMEDPFTNWVSINKSTDNEKFNQFRDALTDEATAQKFDYAGVQMDQYTNYTIMGIDEHHTHYLEARFFEHINTPLVNAILSESNLIKGCTVDETTLNDQTLGFIITMDAARQLGYDEEHLPTYISYLAANENADTLGLKLVMEDFYPVAVPVLAVVRRLPNNVSMMSANFFYEQQHYNDYTHPFDFKTHEEYLHHLLFFVSDEIGQEQFTQKVSEFVPDSLKSSFSILEDPFAVNLKCWKPGKMLTVSLGDERMDRSVFQMVADKIEEQFDPIEVRRVHQLETEDHPSPRSSFLSVEFNSLEHIRAFESFAKEHGIQLEMAQVASKENFNAVTIVARVLSAAMVIFALVCIIMFLVNMLQAYFQKIKRNIGTFKAFGMNAQELIMVYVIILVMIVVTAVVLALAITWLIQTVLPLIGVEKDGFNYLSLWNGTTYIASLVVLIATILTNCVVMMKMLSQTPGDLIYDR